MSYAGIDYRLGKANRDPKTGIHYGIIPLNALNEFALESFEPFYGKPHCPECEAELDDSLVCKLHGEQDGESCYPEEPLSWVCESDGYALEMGEDSDVWVFKSPYYTHAQFCSPCAPGAGYLLNPCEDGPKTYCLGPDWFENDKPPYPVSKV